MGFFSESLPAAGSCVAALNVTVTEPTIRAMHFGYLKDSKFSVFSVKPAEQERQNTHMAFPVQPSAFVLISVI